MNFPGKSESCWIASAPETRYPQLVESTNVDVAIVGAGIVGLTAAYLLARQGVAVAVLEALRVGRQVTGRSTAKVTTQHSLVYAHLIRNHGLETAQMYADANKAGVEQIRRCVETERIACNLERKNAYAYATRASRLRALEIEAEAALRVGLDADVVANTPLPFATAGALRFPDQGQFNPTQYLLGLAQAVTARGGRIFEDTRVDDVQSGRRWRLEAGRWQISAEHVIMATHLPIGGSMPFDKMTRPRAHIALALRADAAPMLDGIFIGVDAPTHSLRMGSDRDGPLLIVLGPSFRNGQERDVLGRFHDLERWVRANVPAGEIAWHWVNQDYETADRIPFAGAAGGKAKDMYVATGFNAWGISNGTAAAMTIVDQVCGRPSPWTELYDPRRRTEKSFNQGGESKSLVRNIDRIANGGGGVIKHGNRKIAVSRSEDGELTALSASCTHKGCTVTWNNAERTWDCPCHGSVYTADGAVIHGPATEPLKRQKLPKPRGS